MSVLYLLVLLAFLAYHARAWSRSRPRAFRPRADRLRADSGGVPEPLVSVLVPAWNGAVDLVPFVSAFRALAYPAKELILCVGGDDGGLEVARAVAGDGVAVLEQRPGMGKQRSLQACLEASRGEIVYLTDIDCRVDDESFRLVLEPILAGREQVVTGSSKPTGEQQRIGAVLVHWALVRKAEGTEGGYVRGLLGRNCALTRSALDAVGGFTFDAPTGTDYRLAQALTAAGHRIWREPSSEVATEYAWPVASYVRKRARWVRNVLLFAERDRQRGEFLNALSVVALPAAMLGAVLLSLLLLAWLPARFALFPLFVVLLLLAHGVLNRLHYLRETLGNGVVRPSTIAGAAVNWLAQLASGLWALFTWVVPGLRKQW